MGSIDDISQLCRLCLVKDQVNIPIFNETSDIEQIFVKINSCLPVKVSRDDNLPKKICDGCSYKLDMLYIFRNTSLDSEKQLIQWLDEAGLNSAPSEQTEVDPLANPLTSTKPEIMVKQETIEPSESRGEGDNSEICMDAQNYIIQQQKLPYEQDFDFGEPSGSSAGLMTDEPAPKRAKRTAAIKKAPLETVEDDLDAAMQITKAEEEDSDEVDQPDYVEPSTSADDQPGPSGVGKPAVEAPSLKRRKTIEVGLLPVLSRKQYEETYKRFLDYCKTKSISSYTENVLVTYFSELSEKRKSSTLWATYSMLKATLFENHHVDITKYLKLRVLLKRQAAGYQPKKSKVLEKHQILKFLLEAPDDMYLSVKVALILGVAGACRCDELVHMKVTDLEDLGNKMLVTISDKKRNRSRSFLITEHLDVVRKYLSKRPPDLDSPRFFFKFSRGKSTKQVIGVHKLGSMPQEVASYLNLPNVKEYTGHCFRKSSTNLRMNRGSDILRLEEHDYRDLSSIINGNYCSLKREFIEIKQEYS